MAGADFSFEIVGELALDDLPQAERVVPLPARRKSYPADAVDLARYIDIAERGLFVAREADALAGYLAVSRGWNGFASIDDVAVGATFSPPRRLGRALIQAAARWATSQGLAGLRAETQSNNIAACRLYQKCGFVLGGYDRLLYAALQPGTAETALLFWYWLLRPAA